MKVFWLLYSRIISHYQSNAATGCTGDDAQRFAIGAHIAGDGGIGPDVGHIDGAGKQRFDGRWAGVETCPLNLRAGAQSFLEPSVGLANHSLRMRDIGERAYADDGLTETREREDDERQPHNNGEPLIHLCPVHLCPGLGFRELPWI